MPHEGGERFGIDSGAYRTLAEWIGSGMTFRGEGEPALTKIEATPRERSYQKGGGQQLTVEATYSDGSRRDVTSLATFDSNDRQIVTANDDGKLQI